jgi:hypothetical protein
MISPAGANLNLRVSYSLKARVLKQVKEGEQVTILEGSVDIEDNYWWRMRTTDGVEGWAVDRLGWFEPVSVTVTSTQTPTP